MKIKSDEDLIKEKDRLIFENSQTDDKETIELNEAIMLIIDTKLAGL